MSRREAGTMRAALARDDALLRDAITAHDGVIVKTTGDGVHARSEPIGTGPKRRVAPRMTADDLASALLRAIDDYDEIRDRPRSRLRSTRRRRHRTHRGPRHRR
jgi:class 3 adenylate cyclase